jgi:predicted O-methyltransferase YrrM
MTPRANRPRQIDLAKALSRCVAARGALLVSSGMRRLLKSIALRIPEIRGLVRQRDDAQRLLREAIAGHATGYRSAVYDNPTGPGAGRLPNSSLYVELEGTPYGRYAIPVDYLPSRDFRPRWGSERPPLQVLDGWFRDNSASYLDFLDAMRTSARQLIDIPVVFDEANLPAPAWSGVPYAPFDGVALYTMIQTHKPRRYLEIGSGISTCFAYRAINDAGLGTAITSIDPEPRATIDNICDDIVRDGLETCDLGIFDQLEAGDIVFFDGSHRSFMNSDVTVFMIDVLPRLKPGVIVHIHDIMLPYDYPDSFRHWYWNEQYLLAVYMMGNKERISPLLPTAFICRDKAFDAAFDTPMIDLGEFNDGWRGGGAMWFTHTA